MSNTAESFITPPTAHISTERLALEPLRIFHAAEMVRVLGDKDLYSFTGGEPPTFDQLTRRYTMQYAGSRHDTEQWHNWIARERATNRAIGFVQATVEATGADVAWTIGAPWQGKGYATEAAQAMNGWLRSHAVLSVQAWIHPDHIASQKVAQALGLSLTDQVDEDGEQCWRGGGLDR